MMKAVVSAIFASVSTAVLVGFFALPIASARIDERVKSLEGKYTDEKGRLDNLDAQVKDSRDKLTEALRQVSESKEAIANVLPAITETQSRIYAVEKNIKSITSIDPLTAECSEIMKEIREPKGMVSISLDEKTGRVVNSAIVELEERFRQLGCAQRVQKVQ